MMNENADLGNVFMCVFRIRNVLIRGSGSADLFYWITDPDPALFFSGFEDANKNQFSKITNYYCKKSQNSRNQGFSNFFSC
jgi:hypothetical protein